MPNEEINIIIEEVVENIDVNINETVEEININVNEGVNSHSQLTLDDGTNPHGTTKSDVGLSLVPNLDTTDAVNNSHTHSNKSILDLITEAFTTTLKSNYDSAYTWVLTNGTNLINHLGNFSNPHGVTKTQIGLGNVQNVDTTTTQNINDSTDKRFVTDAQKTLLGNTSGVNTGDETLSSLQTKRPLKTINSQSIEGIGNIEIEIPLQTILERIGHWTKFNAGVSSNYPFVGGAINSGIVQSVNVTNVINAYGNAFVRFIAASGVANSGYRFSDGNNYPTTFFKGVTFFAVINPIVTTNLSAIIGMPHSASISSATENTTTGAWFNITGTTIQAKCSYLSAVFLAPSQTITANQWLLFMIEVVDNDAINKKIRFKVRQTDGTLVYNEEITSNIQPYNVFSNNMSSGCRAVLTSTPGANTDIFGVNGMGFWGQKPSFLNNF